jgi:hypothetical protein
LRACVVNFDAKRPRSYLADWGQSSVPCANPLCFGRDGKWESVPAKHSTQTGAATVIIDGEGRPMPLASARSKCLCCGKVFAHVNPVTLSRMPPEALRGLPVDLDWAVGDLMLSVPFTRALDYDLVMRQGAANCAAKVATAGAETFTRCSVEYLAAGQAWWQQTVGLASDEPWRKLDEPGQLRLAEARAEFLLASQLVDRVEPFGRAGDNDGFGLCPIAPDRLSRRSPVSSSGGAPGAGRSCATSAARATPPNSSSNTTDFVLLGSKQGVGWPWPHGAGTA